MEQLWACITDGEELEFLSSKVEADSDDELALSVQALSGTEGIQTIRLRGYLKGREVFILVDSGSSHSFINDQLVSNMGSGQVLSHPVKVQVANGELLHCTHQLSNQLWGIQGYSFNTTLKIIPLKGYDVILGMDWLGTHSPMEIHWADKWLQFTHDKQFITLQGISPSANMGAPISHNQLQALDKIDSILYVVQLQALDRTSSTAQAISSLPADLQAILHKYGTVFTSPTELPLERPGDHNIPLLEGAQPFYLRPYRYNPA
jgi:hypothetical protein